jgi:hypothetical protein
MKRVLQLVFTVVLELGLLQAHDFTLPAHNPNCPFV